MASKTKVASRKSKNVVFVYFGSEDNTNMPNDRQYKEMLDRLGQYQPEDIAALPTLIAGDVVLRIRTQKLVLDENEKLTFKAQSRKAPKDLSTDPFLKRTKTQLDLHLTTGSPKFVLVPFYVKVLKSKR